MFLLTALRSVTNQTARIMIAQKILVPIRGQNSALDEKTQANIDGKS